MSWGPTFCSWYAAWSTKVSQPCIISNNYIANSFLVVPCLISWSWTLCKCSLPFNNRLNGSSLQIYKGIYLCSFFPSGTLPCKLQPPQPSRTPMSGSWTQWVCCEFLQFSVTKPCSESIFRWKTETIVIPCKKRWFYIFCPVFLLIIARVQIQYCPFSMAGKEVFI